MGVTSLSRRGSVGLEGERQGPRPAVREPVLETVKHEVAPPPPRPAHPLDAIQRTVSDVGKHTPAIKRMTRGPAFEDARVNALARLSDAREILGAYLDKHPSDDRGNRLWDRLLALYVALKKI